MAKSNLTLSLRRITRGLSLATVVSLSILLGCGGGGGLSGGGSGGNGGGGGGNGGGGGGIGSGRSAPCGQAQPTWTLVNQPFGANPGGEGVVALTVDRTTNTVWTGALGAAAKSTDGGQTWTIVNSGLPADKMVLRIGFNKLAEPIAVVQGGGAELYRLVGGTWVKAQTPYATPAQGYSTLVVDHNGNLDVVVAASGYPLHGDFIRSTDDGATFQLVAANISSVYGGTDLTALTEDRSNGYLYAGGSGETTVGALRSTDGGTTWTLVGTDATMAPAPLTSFAFTKTNQLLMSFGKHTQYPVYRLNPDRTTTPAATLPQYYSGSQMFTSPDGQLFLPVNGSSYSDAGFYCSAGDGLTWVRYHDANLPGTAIEGVIDNNGTVFAIIVDSSMHTRLYKSALPVF